MNLPFTSQNDLVVGIDIGSHAVKVCQLKRTSDGYAIVALGSNVLPEGAVEDGTLNDPEVVAEVISDLFKNLKIRNKKVGFSISGYSVIVKKVNLAVMEEAELEEHIMSEAEQYIPFDIDDVYLDFHDLKTSENPGKTDVMLVAAKKDIVDEYLEMLQSISLTAVVVDVDGFALENVYEYNYEKNDNIALVDIGASKMNINILSQGVSVVARDIIVGSRQLTEQIQNVFDIEFDEAEELKLGSLPAGDKREEIEDIFSATCTQWILEIKKAIDLYHSNHPEQPLKKLILSGGGAKVAGLIDFLAQETDLKIELFNPFANMASNDKRIDADYLKSIGPEMAIAAGIALRPSSL
ncbi:type IV pilus assembly protein PilM [Desulforhopalus sp. IMCC35007]|uniref:type IV pilus assembly protein PilM n=1 Tax=Desulforhopalus sp. IMCC35007 TaxID=2569543 RepID=UPI0010ADFCF3|nr:type IV pilus assembly protein PilM [Desulforhopalus sp. IMCC35007]TKB12089.1 type IV pilus assembly protein PilM [Desulforhopalus sp. IMCC35007]